MEIEIGTFTMIFLFIIALIVATTFSEPAEEIETTGIKGTGSMLPLMYPDAVLDYIPFDGTLKCGHIYIFNQNGTKVVHRFVYEGKNGELYFKGDNNNLIDAPINKSKILSEVVGIR